MAADEHHKLWLGKLTRLNPASGRGVCSGKAPHKPLLLLCLLDLAESGELTSRAVTRSPGLVLRFRNYASITADRWPTRLDMKLPFYHLGTQGFWQPLTVEMQTASSPETCLLIELAPQFYECLLDPGFRVKARMVLISKYFTQPEQAGLFESLGLQVGKNGPLPATDKVMEQATEYAKRKGRCARFAVRVVTEYRFTCALTGYQCTTADGASIVEAAHIEPWTKTQNDTITNGLALSKNAHWMFDEGLWSVDADYRIIVHPTRFIEAGPDALKLQSYAGRSLQFAHNATLRPNPSYFLTHVWSSKS